MSGNFKEMWRLQLFSYIRLLSPIKNNLNGLKEKFNTGSNSRLTFMNFRSTSLALSLSLHTHTHTHTHTHSKLYASTHSTHIYYVLENLFYPCFVSLYCFIVFRLRFPQLNYWYIEGPFAIFPHDQRNKRKII